MNLQFDALLAAAGSTAPVLLKSTLVLAAAALLAVALTHARAAARHLVWGLGLAGAAALPLLMALLPSLAIPLGSMAPAAASRPGGTAVVARVTAPELQSARAGVASLDLPVAVTPAVAAPAAGPAAPARPVSRLPLALWLAGVVAVLARLGVGLARARSLARRARPVTLPAEVLTELGARPAVAAGSSHPISDGGRVGLLACPQQGVPSRVRPPTAPRSPARADDRVVPCWAQAVALDGAPDNLRVLAGEHIAVPMTTGLLRPVLLLPAGFASWSAERLGLVLRHEIAHVSRRDALTQALAQVALALCWFHPLAHLAVRRLRHEAELAADDRVVTGTGVRPSLYAEHLLALARCLTRRPPRLVAAVAITGTPFERRLRALLARRPSRGPLPLRLAAAAALPFLACVALLAAADVQAAPGDGESKRTRRGTSESAHHRAARSAGEAFGRAYEAHRDNRYDDAIAGWQEALERGYRPATSMYNLACAFALKGDRDRALEWLEKAVAEGFDSGDHIETDSDLRSLRSEPRFRKLVEELGGSERAKALRRVERLEARKEMDGGDWYEVGMELHQVGEYDRAIAAWRRAEELGEREGASTYNIACALSLEGDREAALETLDRAIEAGYGDPDHLDRDDDLDPIRNDPRFERLVEKAAALELPDDDRQRGRRRRPWRKAAWSEARERFEKYVQQNPRSGRGWFNLGYAALRLDDTARAAEAFGRAVELGHRKATSEYNLACTYAVAGDEERAFQWLDRALASGFDNDWSLATDPDLDSIRDDPRFPEFAKDVEDGWKVKRHDPLPGAGRTKVKEKHEERHPLPGAGAHDAE